MSAMQQVLNKYAGKNIVVGSHGTALSTIINYYDHSFGYNDFEKIKNVMPWIVEFVFDEKTKCIMIKEHDLFWQSYIFRDVCLSLSDVKDMVDKEKLVFGYSNVGVRRIECPVL